MDRYIIDAHVHCFPEKLAAKAVRSVKEDAQRLTDGTFAGQCRMMQKNHVQYAVLLNMAGRPDTMHNVNRFALECRGPQFFSCGSIHPFAEDAMEELEFLYSQGVRGIKFHTGHQAFNFDDPHCKPLYRRIGALGMIVLVHCGRSAKSSEHLVWPETVARAVEWFDGTPFICAHMGGLYDKPEQMELLKSLPVWVDTALMKRYLNVQQFSEMVQNFGADRVLFGSDVPWGDFAGNAALLEHASLSPQEKNKIFYDNACKLFGFPQHASIAGAQKGI